jgi:hypothetical protein
MIFVTHDVLTFMQKVNIFTLSGDVTYLMTVVGLFLYMYRKGSCTGNAKNSIHCTSFEFRYALSGHTHPKLSSGCFAMRTVVPLMTADTLKLVYFAYFHCVLSYGLIFWENSTNSNKVFKSKRK